MFQGVETTNQFYLGLESRSLQTNPAKLETALLERAHRTQQNLLQKDFAWLSRLSKDALGWLKAFKKAGAVRERSGGRWFRNRTGFILVSGEVERLFKFML